MLLFGWGADDGETDRMQKDHAILWLWNKSTAVRFRREEMANRGDYRKVIGIISDCYTDAEFLHFGKMIDESQAIRCP